MTMDVVGRLKRVEELNWDQSVYSTTNYTYNARDQVTNTNQAGQLRSFEYDGYGRLWRRTTPEQGQTTYSFFADNTVQTVTDARGASFSLSYNNRHLTTAITYGVPAGVAATPNVTFEYDAAGNRTRMVDGSGERNYVYNTLSQLTSESRNFTGLPSSYVYSLSYDYTLGGDLKSVTNHWGWQTSYAHDHTGRITAVTGTPYAGVSTYVSGLQYRAWGAPKQIAYGNGKSLSMSYDNRLRMTQWNIPNVMGWNYAYSTPLIPENTGRVAFADNIYDATLDRSYDYDNVGRMWASHTGVEGNGHAGYSAWGPPTGPYAQNYSYDQLGNMTWRNGWGAINSQYYYSPQFVNNRMTVNPVTGAAMQYDASGNLTNDGQQTYTYDATGQQATASGTGLSQGYDGDGVRVKKTENGATTYYLRSTVLGGKVIAEVNGGGGWQRGYVYMGGQMLAIQDGAAKWVHQDLVTKSQRLTDASGNVVSWVDLDPWGGETGRSSNQWMQPYRYTSYERDGNGGDEAMMRRYEGRWQRFAQPDPYDGSYDVTNPQSFNRYSYVGNDPVNAVDPSGLAENYLCEYYGFCGGYSGADRGWRDVSAGFFGGSGNINDRPRAGLWEIYYNEISLRPYIQWEMFRFYFPFTSIFADYELWGGYSPQEKPQSKPESFGQAFKNCVSEHFGLNSLVGITAAQLGQATISKPGALGSAAETSRASQLARGLFGNARVPGGVRLPAPTWGNWLSKSARVGTVVGRWVPIIGWALLAYDAIKIGICVESRMNP
jgi:RHS repeat-associated protein